MSACIFTIHRIHMNDLSLQFLEEIIIDRELYLEETKEGPWNGFQRDRRSGFLTTVQNSKIEIMARWLSKNELLPAMDEDLKEIDSLRLEQSFFQSTAETDGETHWHYEVVIPNQIVALELKFYEKWKHLFHLKDPE